MADDASRAEPSSGQRITFVEDPPSDTTRGIFPRSRSRYGSRSRSRSRSRHRNSESPDGNSIHRRSLSINTDVPIQYRTLSIQVSESIQRDADLDIARLKRQNKEPHLPSSDGPKEALPTKEEDEDYFAQLHFHQQPTNEVYREMKTSIDRGLSENEVLTRLEQYGTNTLPKTRSNYLKKIFFYIFGGFCSILWVGVIIFFICWKPLSNPPSPTNLAMAVLVLIVIFFQASFSAFQDWSTSRVMASISALLPSSALVLRDGARKSIPASQLVIGDIVILEIGNKVPADLRILQHSGDIRFDRAVLTGESEEVQGAVDATDTNFLESRNIALMGTIVTNGSGIGVVILTGASSVMGRIAQATTSVKEKPTLIQKEISRFVLIIIGLTLTLASLILFTWLGWLRRDHFAYMNVVAMLNNVMGCVVAFIPEGMPVGVALTLLRVAKRMKNIHILPKGLATVETLGCVNVICSDKTGTLTQNQMLVTTVAHVDHEFDSVDDFFRRLSSNKPAHGVTELHRAAVLCNQATFHPDSVSRPINQRTVQGNATDGAILRFAESAMAAEGIRKSNERCFHIPFNSKNKWMLTLHRLADDEKGSRYLALIKGAPDVLLPGCAKFWAEKTDTVEAMDRDTQNLFKTLQDKMSRNAERVLVLCQKTMRLQNTMGTNAFHDEVVANVTSDLTVVGILGILDPPRPETAYTVAECRRAGSRFFMVTGDYGLTAAAIARSIGIFTCEGDPDNIAQIQNDDTLSAEEMRDLRVRGETRSLILDGSSIQKLSDEDWDLVCEYPEIVFARTTPEQKLRIVNEFQKRDNVVAVTGDGVNDAPALRAANVGVAIGAGSDVAIDAADLVLLDKFSSIIDAIRLGRLVFQNLQKVIAYLLPAGSWSEIWPVLINVFFGVPLPLSSFLMIIICVFTDLFLSLSLIMEKEEFDLLSLPPRNHKKDHLINMKIYTQAYLFMGVMETTIAHSMYFLYFWRHARIPIKDLFFLFEGYTEGFHGYSQEQLTAFNVRGQCVYFVTLVVLQWGNILSVRNRRLSIFQADPITKKRRNPWLLASILISLVIAVFVTEVPGIQTLFSTSSVPMEFWLIPIPLALGILSMDELRKLAVRIFPHSLLSKIAW